MRYFLDKNIYLLPIILLIVTLLSIFIRCDFVIVGNIVGYSIATNVAFLYLFYRDKYCWFTKLSPIGLIIINLVDIMGNFVSDKFYNFWYVVTVFTVIIFLTLILEINKRMNK
jgi:hypothetical protein